MLVQFVTDCCDTFYGFSAKIHYTLINPICKDWLNITSGFLTSPISITSGYLNSPEYPTQDCNWVITASVGSTISIQFHTFEVKYQLNVKLKKIVMFVLTLYITRLKIIF